MTAEQAFGAALREDLPDVSELLDEFCNHFARHSKTAGRTKTGGPVFFLKKVFNPHARKKPLSNVQRQFAKRNNGNRRALDECAAKMESTLESMTFDELAKDTSVPRHKVVIKPTAKGADMQGLDLFIDRNFIGNTPITTDVEEGVREVALRKGGNTLWNKRIQILKNVWLTPDLGN